MSLFKYLELQVIDPQEDGSISELDYYSQDDIIDLNNDEDGDSLAASWSAITRDMHE